MFDLSVGEDTGAACRLGSVAALEGHIHLEQQGRQRHQ